MREGARSRGDDPDELPRRYARLINAAIANRPKGNDDLRASVPRELQERMGQPRAGMSPWPRCCSTSWPSTAISSSTTTRARAISRRCGTCPKGKTVVLGLVSSKVGQLESKDELKRRIDMAAKLVPMEQLCLSPQCGFSSTVHGNDIAMESQAAKLRLVVETARDVWGGV
jgi:5-methyltetrahydropteroyltriglutamate--homocysteine methyltransferase